MPHTHQPLMYKVTYGFVDSDVTFHKYMLGEDDMDAAYKADDLKDSNWTLIDIERHEEN
tara:strand:+ start:1659 stop:1835 length:177 start_codon:yes stop_codon:yes gene_type:complete